MPAFSIRRPGRQLVVILKWLTVFFTLALTAVVIDELIVAPWNALVSDSHRLMLWTVLALISIFLCSCAELAVSETKDSHINEWTSRVTGRFGGVETPRHRILRRYAEFVTGHSNIVNPIIILANMSILIVYTSIFLPDMIDHASAAGAQTASLAVPLLGVDMPIRLSRADAFTGIGVTLLLFLMAELIPKQIALRWRIGALVWTSWWVLIIAVPCLVPAYGLAKPVIKLLSIGKNGQD